MKKEIKKIKINKINFIKKYYIPSSHKLRSWITCSLVKIFSAEITLIMAGKQRIKSINQKYLNQNKPTNVLSFNNSLEINEENMIGDIILCPEIIYKESRQYCISADMRWAHMIVHSMLHLQGYDHKIKSQRSEMEKKEINLLHKMNFSNPYVSN